MEVVRLELPKHHPAQAQVATEATRFSVLCCGRRWGKTTFGIDRLLRPALAGHPAAWFAPNSKLFDEVWRESTRLLQPVTLRADSQKNRIELVTGGVIDFWTLHNTDDPGRGRKYAGIFIDEAAIANRLETQWTEAIRPTLTDYEGFAWFGSTPKGLNYFHDLYQRGLKGGEWRAWKMPTSANPHIPTREIEAARTELPVLTFAQEYLADFVTGSGGAFKEPMRYEPAALPTSGFKEATGCDFAYTSKAGDWTAFVRGRLAGGKLYITDVFREQSEVNDWAARLRLEPSPLAFIGGQEKGITQLLRTMGVKIRTIPAVTDKLARARPASAAWNRGDILVPTAAPWMDDFLPEVLAFTGDPKMDAHDDVVDALAALHHALMGNDRPDYDAARRAMGVA